MVARVLARALLVTHAATVSTAAMLPSIVLADEDQARFVIRAALSARESVYAGHVQITGHYRYHVFQGAASYEGPIRGIYVFDRVKNVYRFDGERPSKGCNR